MYEAGSRTSDECNLEQSDAHFNADKINKQKLIWTQAYSTQKKLTSYTKVDYASQLRLHRWVQFYYALGMSSCRPLCLYYFHIQLHILIHTIICHSD